MPCKCCRCAVMVHPSVIHPFDSLSLSDLDENTLILPSSRNHTLDNILNHSTDRMIDLIPVQKKRQFLGRSNASSAGLVAALRWTSMNNNIDENAATSIDQMREAAMKAQKTIYQSTSQAMNQHAQSQHLHASTGTTMSSLSSDNQSVNQLVNQSISQSIQSPTDCPCECHQLEHSIRFDENSNTLNLPSHKSISQSNAQSINQSTLATPLSSRPATASKLQSDTAIYRGGQSKMTEAELSNQSVNQSSLDQALNDLTQSVSNLSMDQPDSESINQSTNQFKPKKKKINQSPIKKELTADQKAALLARHAVRQAEIERKKRDDVIKLIQVKADDKFYHEMMLKQYERKVKMQEYQRRHEAQRAERLRQSNDSNHPSKSQSINQSINQSRSFSHRFQPHSSASIVNEKPVFAEFGARNTHTKVRAHYMKTHNITPDLPPNHSRNNEPQSYSQSRRAAINQLHQREMAIARLGSSSSVEPNERDRKVAEMARSFPPPSNSRSIDQSIKQSINQNHKYRVVRHPYPAVNDQSHSLNQSIATVVNDPIRFYQHRPEAYGQ